MTQLLHLCASPPPPKLLKTALLHYLWYQELSFSTTPHASRGRRIFPGQKPHAPTLEKTRFAPSRQYNTNTSANLLRSALERPVLKSVSDSPEMRFSSSFHSERLFMTLWKDNLY